MKVFLVFLLVSGYSLWAQSISPIYHIKYVTTDNIYLDAGNADSLAVGDRLIVKRADSSIAELEIVFVAEHSSSCKVVGIAQEIKIGDLAQLTQRVARPQSLVPVVDTTNTTTPKQALSPQQTVKPSLARIDGSVSFQLYRFSDRSPSHLNFTQPSLRLNLRAGNLFGRNINLRILSHSRYNQRSRAYSNDVPKTEWRNRFYQFSLSYANEQSPYHFEAGRIISNNFSGIGYIDGFLAQRKTMKIFQFGGFGGTQPQWQYSGFQTSLQKYGAFGSLTIGDFQHNRLESTLALAGEYHGRTVSREFVFVRNSLNLGRIWNFYQSSEVDMNRAWRKAKAGQSLTMTNLYLSARGRLSGWLTAALSYDSRKNYWTFETRSLSDSLFDNFLRQGMRADLVLRPGKTFSIFTNFGYHKRSADTRATYSGGAGFNKSNFLSVKQYLNFRLAGFSSPFTSGYNGSITLGRYLWMRNLFSLVYGAYDYSFNGAGANRLNQWIQVNGQLDLTRKTYIMGTYEYDTGSDTNGNRIIGELGYRF